MVPLNPSQGAIIGSVDGYLSNCNANYTLSGNQTQSYDAFGRQMPILPRVLRYQSNLQTTYSAANQIILTPGFIANLNTNFLATIQPCLTYRIGNDVAQGEALSNSGNSILLFPNPASMISIRIDDAHSKTRFKIYNSTMQLVKFLVFESGIENYLAIVDLADGIYFIDAQTDEQSYRTKFVVSR
ncbi:MAG: T9SS type A sorting domain-containing protein [Saprospiraceae bacterium]|nr:T9SS type A sorting domain-containing protein [Candidatus Vicinibacter affinis]